MRGFVFFALIALVVVWTALCALDGVWTYALLASDTGGYQAYKLSLSSVGTLAGSLSDFEAQWHTSEFRSMWLQNFLGTFLPARLLIWGLPSIFLLLIAVLLRKQPRSAVIP